MKTKLYKNGAQFVGEVSNGKKNGQGTYTYANGNNYEGEWKDGALISWDRIK